MTLSETIIEQFKKGRYVTINGATPKQDAQLKELAKLYGVKDNAPTQMFSQRFTPDQIAQSLNNVRINAPPAKQKPVTHDRNLTAAPPLSGLSAARKQSPSPERVSAAQSAANPKPPETYDRNIKAEPPLSGLSAARMKPPSAERVAANDIQPEFLGRPPEKRQPAKQPGSAVARELMSMGVTFNDTPNAEAVKKILASLSNAVKNSPSTATVQQYAEYLGFFPLTPDEQQTLANTHSLVTTLNNTYKTLQPDVQQAYGGLVKSTIGANLYGSAIGETNLTNPNMQNMLAAGNRQQQNPPVKAPQPPPQVNPPQAETGGGSTQIQQPDGQPVQPKVNAMTNAAGAGGTVDPSIGIRDIWQYTPNVNEVWYKNYLKDQNKQAWARLSKYQDMIRDPNSQWYTDPNFDTAKGSAKYNLNGMTPEETLKYARLADRLNNRVYYQQGMTNNLGPLGGSVGTEGSVYQMPRVETEETRQRETMRTTEQQRRAADEQRRQYWMMEELLTNRLNTITELERQGIATEADRREKEEIRAEMIRLGISLPTELALQAQQSEYMQWLNKYKINDYIYTTKIKPFIDAKNFIGAALATAVYGNPTVMPNAQQLLTQNVINDLDTTLRKEYATREQQEAAVEQVLSKYAAVLGATVKGLGKPVIDALNDMTQQKGAQ